MSGHSKWANIKHKKAKGDAEKGKIFTKLGREIAVAVKQGGSDIATNSKLADTIAKAKANNMPNDNISRSIKKAAGELGTVNYEEMLYEGYGVSGSAVIVKALTDNKNRAAGDIRHCFDKCGGSMGQSGCVSFTFDNKGIIVVERSLELDEDKLMEIAIEAGADDVVTSDDIFEIFTSPSAFSEVRKYLEQQNLAIVDASIQMVPQNMITLNESETKKFEKMLEMLEDLDDVQEVFHNVELPEEEDDE